MGTMFLTCFLLSFVAPLASAEGFLGGSSSTQDSRPWAVLHSCSYCSENAGTWISVTTFEECEAKCSTAKSPYMVFKAKAASWPAWPTNCRCDAACNGQLPYPSCEGNVYHKDVSNIATTVSPPAKQSTAADSDTVLIDDGSMTLSKDSVTQKQRLDSDIHIDGKTVTWTATSTARLPQNEPKVADDSKEEEADAQAAMAYEKEMSSEDDQDDEQDDSSSIDADVDKLQDHVNELQEQLTHPDNFYEPEYSNDLILLQSQVSDIQGELLGELTKLKALSVTNQVLGARIHDVAVLQKVVKRIQQELTRRRDGPRNIGFLANQMANAPTSDVHTPEQAQPRNTEVIMVLLQNLRKHVTSFGSALRKDSLDHRRKTKHGTVHSRIVPDMGPVKIKLINHTTSTTTVFER